MYNSPVLFPVIEFETFAVCAIDGEVRFYSDYVENMVKDNGNIIRMRKVTPVNDNDSGMRLHAGVNYIGGLTVKGANGIVSSVGTVNCELFGEHDFIVHEISKVWSKRNQGSPNKSYNLKLEVIPTKRKISHKDLSRLALGNRNMDAWYNKIPVVKLHQLGIFDYKVVKYDLGNHYVEFYCTCGMDTFVFSAGRNSSGVWYVLSGGTDISDNLGGAVLRCVEHMYNMFLIYYGIEL
jgi:hypothetical protein